MVKNFKAVTICSSANFLPIHKIYTLISLTPFQKKALQMSSLFRGSPISKYDTSIWSKREGEKQRVDEYKSNSMEWAKSLSKRQVIVQTGPLKVANLMW